MNAVGFSRDRSLPRQAEATEWKHASASVGDVRVDNKPVFHKCNVARDSI
jgi:hypothetical protein